MSRKPPGELRRGWTTGACATAATKAALILYWSGERQETVSIALPRGGHAEFDVHAQSAGEDWAMASVIKDAGDDPDVTHGAEIVARLRASGGGIRFEAGPGVGKVTKPGLPLPVGAPAINPVPRQMIETAIKEIAERIGKVPDITVEISVPGGEELAKKTWNPRLGIVGGISILGTTGIVRPFSCAAWIASIHRGIDVARASGLAHVVGATGATSEQTAQAHFDLPDHAILDMGDFVGGMVKYLAKHPVARVTIAGGPGKLTKLAQGAMDLHSARTQVDFAALGALARAHGGPAEEIARAGTALEAFTHMPALAAPIAQMARAQVAAHLPQSTVDVLLVGRSGEILGSAP